MDKSKEWKEKALEAYSKYLDALERDLPPQSSIGKIEKAMLKHYPEMMSQTMQLLADHQELSPPRDT